MHILCSKKEIICLTPDVCSHGHGVDPEKLNDNGIPFSILTLDKVVLIFMYKYSVHILSFLSVLLLHCNILCIYFMGTHGHMWCVQVMYSNLGVDKRLFIFVSVLKF